MTQSLEGGLRRHPLALFEAIGLAVRVEIALRRRSFASILRQIDTIKPRSAPLRPIPSQTFERAISFAYRILPFESTCLKRALVFALYRKRRGLSAELRIGVQKREDEFAAHAWIEDADGAVLTDPQSGFMSMPPLRGSNQSGKASD